MAIILIIALVVGGGVSLAAENALPGDVLFPVKIVINDNLRSALAVTVNQQAKLDAKLAQKRLEEAEKIAAQGKLNEEVKAKVEANFEKRAEAAREHIAELRARGNTELAAEVSSDLESALKAHEAILVNLGAKKNINVLITPLVVKVKSNAQAIARARAELEKDIREAHQELKELKAKMREKQAEVRATASAAVGFLVDVRAAAEGKMKAAENKIAEVRKFIEKNRERLGAQAVAEAEARLKVADQTLAEGKAKLEAGAFGEAFALFQRAHRIAQEAKLLVVAKIELKVDIDIKIDGRIRGDDCPPSEGTDGSGQDGVRILRPCVEVLF